MDNESSPRVTIRPPKCGTRSAASCASPSRVTPGASPTPNLLRPEIWIVTLSRMGSAKMWDARSGALLWTFSRPHRWALGGCPSNSSGTRLATTSNDGTVGGLESRPFPVRASATHASAPGETRDLQPMTTPAIATALGNGAVRIWTRDGKLVSELASHDPLPPGFWPRLDWHPDGHRLIVSGNVQAVEWDLRKQVEIARFGDHGDMTTHAIYAPDGSRIVTVGSDGTAKLWQRDRAEPALVFKGHQSRVRFCRLRLVGAPTRHCQQRQDNSYLGRCNWKSRTSSKGAKPTGCFCSFQHGRFVHRHQRMGQIRDPMDK